MATTSAASALVVATISSMNVRCDRLAADVDVGELHDGEAVERARQPRAASPRPRAPRRARVPSRSASAPRPPPTAVAAAAPSSAVQQQPPLRIARAAADAHAPAAPRRRRAAPSSRMSSMPIHTNAGHASALRTGWCERHRIIVAGIDSPSATSEPGRQLPPRRRQRGVAHQARPEVVVEPADQRQRDDEKYDEGRRRAACGSKSTMHAAARTVSTRSRSRATPVAAGEQPRPPTLQPPCAPGVAGRRRRRAALGRVGRVRSPAPPPARSSRRPRASPCRGTRPRPPAPARSAR